MELRRSVAAAALLLSGCTAPAGGADILTRQLADGSVEVTVTESSGAATLLAVSPSGGYVHVERDLAAGERRSLTIPPVEGGTWAVILVRPGGWDGTLRGLLRPEETAEVRQVEIDGTHTLPPEGDVRVALTPYGEDVLAGDPPELEYRSAGARTGQVTAIILDAERTFARVVRAVHAGSGAYPFSAPLDGAGPWHVIMDDGTSVPHPFHLTGETTWERRSRAGTG